MQNLSKAHYLAGKLKPRFSGPFFNEFVAQADGQNVASINRTLEGHKIIGGLPLERYYPELKNTMLLCSTEMTQRSHMDQVAGIPAPRRRRGVIEKVRRTPLKRAPVQ